DALDYVPFCFPRASLPLPQSFPAASPVIPRPKVERRSGHPIGICMKFNQRVVNGLVSDGSEKFFWDDSLPGFGIRIKPSGARTYLTQSRRGARQRRYAIGACGTFRLEEARERARRLLVSIHDGGDPSGDRKQKRQAPTVQALAERYLQEYAKTHKRPS